MKPQRYQFTISRLLLATTFFALSTASGAALRVCDPRAAPLLFMGIPVFLGAGIGVMFDRPIMGAVMGLIVFLIAFFL